MTEEKLADLFADISSHIASIDAQLTIFLQKLADHERRLCEMEHPSERGGLAATLAKALVYMAAALAAGAGASGILSKFGG